MIFKLVSMGRLVPVLIVISAFYVADTKPAKAELNCEVISGKWSGTMRGAFSGKTSMSIKKCKITWRLPDGRTNRCRYKEKSDQIEYNCSLGSRGIVKINGNNITMQNIYTARQHGAYTVNINKLN